MDYCDQAFNDHKTFQQLCVRKGRKERKIEHKK